MRARLLWLAPVACVAVFGTFWTRLLAACERPENGICFYAVASVGGAAGVGNGFFSLSEVVGGEIGGQTSTGRLFGYMREVGFVGQHEGEAESIRAARQSVTFGFGAGTAVARWLSISLSVGLARVREQRALSSDRELWTVLSWDIPVKMALRFRWLEVPWMPHVEVGAGWSLHVDRDLVEDESDARFHEPWNETGTVEAFALLGWTVP